MHCTRIQSLLALALYAASASAATRIVESLKLNDGVTAMKGKIYISGPSGSATIASTNTTITIGASGAVDFSLAGCNGCVYKAQYQLTNAAGTVVQTFTETWVVPDTGSTLNIHNNLQGGSSTPYYLVSPHQINASGLTAGQIWVWDGAAWVAATNAAGGSGVADPGSNGVMKRTGLNTTGVVSGNPTDCVFVNGGSGACGTGGGASTNGTSGQALTSDGAGGFGTPKTLATSATTDTTNASNITSGTLPAGRLPAHTGDATSSAGSAALTLATVNSAVGTCGDATHVSQVTLDGKGRATGCTPVSISAGSGDMLAATYATSGSAAPSDPCPTAGAQYRQTGVSPTAFYSCSANGGSWVGPFFAADTSKSGTMVLSGLSSGAVGLAAADAAGTPILYILPTTAGTSGQVLADNGVTTCGTYAAGSPTLCHALIWTSLATVATTGSAADLSGALADARLSSNVPLKSGNNVYTGTQDATGATSTAPMKTGTSVPGTCAVGAVFFKSDATAGQNLYYCTSTNTFTQQLNSGGSPGGSAGQVQYNSGGSFAGISGGYTSLISGATQYQNPDQCVTYSSTVTTDFGGTAATSLALKLFTAPAYWDPRSFRIEETTAITTSGTTGGAAVTALYGCIGSLTVPCGYKSAFPLMGASSPTFAASPGGTTLASTVNGTQDVYLYLANSSATATGYLSNITAGVVKVRVCGVTLQ